MSQPIIDAGLWCRRYRPALDAPHRLICFPHAGGASTFFMPVAAALSPQVDVVAIQYPGRQDRRNEPVIDDIRVLADRVHEVVRDQADRPLTFFGHSMGAVVAFEVARRLQAEGRAVTRVFVSGRRAPSTYRDEQVHLRDDAGMIAEMRQMSGTNSLVLADDELMRAVLPAVRADYRAIETYQCDPDAVVTCSISALVGDDDAKTTVDEARAWQQHTSGSFELKVFSGGHFYLNDRAAEVIEVLRRHIQAEHARSVG